MLSESDLLYFASIPKTAGTTLYHIIYDYFPVGTAAPVQTLSHLMQFDRHQIKHYRLIGGHYFYNVEPIFQRTPVYITMLRDPVSRTVSEYAHARRSREHYAHHKAATQSLREFVQDSSNLAMFTNAQVRYLGQNHNIQGVYSSLSQQELSEHKLERSLSEYAPQGLYDESALALAWDRLKALPFFGLQEHFDRSLDLICQKFGWGKPERYQSHLVYPFANEVDPVTRSVIEKNTELDRELYRRAEALFFAR